MSAKHSVPSGTNRNDSTALPAGTRLDGRYIVQSVLGAGGFGVTYKAEHETLKTLCAIKENFPRQCAYRDQATSSILPTDRQTFQWAHERFLDEARRLAICRHPNIVGVSNVFEENGTAYMVLEYEGGQTLGEWLAALGRAPNQAEIDSLLSPILDALDYVHGQGVLHRDIAPDNIMIRRDGKPCLIDFGAAREAIAERSQMMSAIVKPGYSPLEQFSREGKTQGPWSDIYALGATLYRAVTGAAPPDAADRAIEDSLQPVRAMISNPQQYRAAFLVGIDQALRLRQVERPKSIREWRTRLMHDEHAVERASPLPSPAKPIVPLPARASRTPLFAGVAAVAVAAITLSVFVLGQQPSAVRPDASLTAVAGKVAASPAAIPAPQASAPVLVQPPPPAVASAPEAPAATQTPPGPAPPSPAVASAPEAQAATQAPPGPAPPPPAVASAPEEPAATQAPSGPEPPSPAVASAPEAPAATQAPPGPAPPSPAAALANAPEIVLPAMPRRRIEEGMCFNEFRSKATARVQAANQDACAANCEARPQSCDAWEYLELRDQRANCALYSPAPTTTLPCSAAGAGTTKGSIGYRP